MTISPVFCLADTLQKWIANASSHRGNSIYSMHQLRIATRKCQAFLSLLEPAFSPRFLRNLNGIFNKIRKKAGKTRNLQLFLDNIRKTTFSNTKTKRIFTSLIQKNIRRRKVRFRDFAQKHNPKISKVLKKFNLKIKSNISKIQPRIEHSEIRDFQERIRNATKRQNIGFAEIHGLRISAKRLRYKLEIANEIYSQNKHRTTIRHLRKTQKTLGKITDQKVFIFQMKVLRKTLKKKSITALLEIDALTSQAKKKFRKSKSALCLKKRLF